MTAIKSGLDIINIAALVLFYVFFLALGIWISRRFKHGRNIKTMLVGKRDLKFWTGMCSLTATWAGGQYISGISEIIFRSDGGLVWAQVMLCDALGLMSGGLLFAEKMRAKRYVTMLDPFHHKYGKIICGLLFLPALLGDLLWTASMLSSFGATLMVIVKMESTSAIILSAILTTSYTVLGGFYSVVYTGIVHFLWMFFGLLLEVPFAITNPLVKPIASTALTRTVPYGHNGTQQVQGWLGKLEALDAFMYVDNFFAFTLGAIPWQAYFQRVLSANTARDAKHFSFGAAIGCILFSVPSVLNGAVAVSADWQQTGFYNETRRGPINNDDGQQIMALVLRYICPPAITFLGVGVVSAAVMSSVDSSILASSSMFAYNVLKPILWPSASDRQVIWSMRFSIAVASALACVIAIKFSTIRGLWELSSDLVYVILFPQLFAVMYIDWSNSYGSLTSYIVGMVLRVSAGESLLGLPALIRYPAYVEQPNGDFYQRFPVKTLCMLSSLTTLVTVSFITNQLFTRGILPASWDAFRCVVPQLESTSAEGDDFDAVLVANMQMRSFARHKPRKDASTEQFVSATDQQWSGRMFVGQQKPNGQQKHF